MFWKHRKDQKYDDVFAWKYHDIIMIIDIYIYDWYFRANPDGNIPTVTP